MSEFDSLIASSPVLATFMAIPEPYLWMILFGALCAMFDIRITAVALIVLSMIALSRTPANAWEYGASGGSTWQGAYPKRSRNNYNPFSTGYMHRTERMSRYNNEPHVMYNGGYVDTWSRFQPSRNR
jgi:hypothetical protein